MEYKLKLVMMFIRRLDFDNASQLLDAFVEMRE